MKNSMVYKNLFVWCSFFFGGGWGGGGLFRGFNRSKIEINVMMYKKLGCYIDILLRYFFYIWYDKIINLLLFIIKV